MISYQGTIMIILLTLFALPLSILVGLKHWGIYNINSIIPVDITLIGALFLIVMQFLVFMWVSKGNQGNSIGGMVVKMVMAAPGVLYLVNIFYPLNLFFDLDVVITLFLFTEGIYGLH